MKKAKLLLVGTGNMARQYAKVLIDLEIPFDVHGNTREGTQAFSEEFGPERSGCEEDKVDPFGFSYDYVIICSPIESMYGWLLRAIEASEARILIEKPLSLSFSEIESIRNLGESKAKRILVGYNRRFYSIAQNARSIITQEGGAKQVVVDFSDRFASISKSSKSFYVKKHWVLANCSHVIDMAFFVAGFPLVDTFTFSKNGSLSFHPSGANFHGIGLLQDGCMACLHGSLSNSGSWSIQVITEHSKLVFSPLEKLTIYRVGEDPVVHQEISDFKPGLRSQVSHLINAREYGESLYLAIETSKLINQMCGYDQDFDYR